MKEILLLILAGVLVDNLALEQLLGISPLLGFSRKGGKLTVLGLCVTVVMLVSALVLIPLEGALAAAGLGYMGLVVKVLVILLVAYLLELAARCLIKDGLGVYFPLIALNGAVLGLALLNAAEGYGLGMGLAAALGAGLGFTLALLLMNGVLSRVDMKAVPAAFRGLPVSLLCAAILAMALTAFK